MCDIQVSQSLLSKQRSLRRYAAGTQTTFEQRLMIFTKDRERTQALGGTVHVEVT
jgi:hypothetical protein